VCQTAFMADTSVKLLAHFGKQVKKERQARGWTLPELERHTGIDAGHWSRIERGVRPPTELIAARCDEVFPERKGWFSEYYRDSRSWAPPGFRSWTEELDNASSLRDWCPSIITGFLQTEDYARVQLSVHPDVTDEVVSTRLAGRMAHQKRLFDREVPTLFLIDQLALYRLMGRPEIMAAQMQHLVSLASRPRVTIQVVPAVAVPSVSHGITLTDRAAYSETSVNGNVWTDEETRSSLGRVFDTLRSESEKASESLRTIERLGELWTGGNLLTATATAGSAWKPAPKRDWWPYGIPPIETAEH
jgi:transcriptional regulator with XRE-family HTH domain